MRILLLNPNMTDDVTTRMAEAGQAVASASTELVPVTASRGVPYISSPGGTLVPKTRRSALSAAQYPHIPCTPPPGGVELEQRKKRGLDVA